MISMDILLRKKEEYFEKYLSHKRLFNIVSNDILECFENFLLDSSDFDLECSCRIEGNHYFPARFNLWFRNNLDYPETTKKIFNFFSGISSLGFHLDILFTKSIINNSINFSKVNHVVAGIDIRDNKVTSRVKIWISAVEYPDLVNKVLSLHGLNNKVAELIYSNSLLFGIDLYFNGQSRIKIYPLLSDYFLKNIAIAYKLKSIFSNKIIKLIYMSKSLNICFKSDKKSRNLYFSPIDSTEFLKHLNCHSVNKMYNRLSCLPSYTQPMFAFKENELDSNLINFSNLYY